MFAVMNFRPAFCPSCGVPLQFGTAWARQDWTNGCSQQCKCGLKFQHAPTEAILDAAEKHPHGDMKRYAQQEGY